MSGPALVILLAGLGYIATVVAVVGSVIRTDAEIELREQDDLMTVADSVQGPSIDDEIAACDFQLWSYENGWEMSE